MAKSIKVAICYTKLNPQGIELSNAMAAAVQICGDIAIPVKETSFEEIKNCKVIFQVCDYNTRGDSISEIVKFRKKIWDYSQANHIKRFIIDTGFIKNGRSHYILSEDDNYQIGLDGIKGLSVPYYLNSPDDKWKSLKVDLKPWRTEGKHILVLGQHERGISTNHLNILEWWEDIIVQIRQISNRKIVFRGHPNQARFPNVSVANYEVKKHTDNTIEHMLNGAWCAVGRTTNGLVDAVINGIPIITPDKISMAYNVAEHNIQNIENPAMPDRTQWKYDLAYAQWSFKDMKNGTAWRYLRKLI